MLQLREQASHLPSHSGELGAQQSPLLLAAAVALERRLVRVALVAWLVYAVPHLVFHLTALEPFGATDAAANVGGLGLTVVIPLALLVLSRRLDQAQKWGPVSR